MVISSHPGPAALTTNAAGMDPMTTTGARRANRLQSMSDRTAMVMRAAETTAVRFVSRIPDTGPMTRTIAGETTSPTLTPLVRWIMLPSRTAATTSRTPISMGTRGVDGLMRTRRPRGTTA